MFRSFCRIKPVLSGCLSSAALVTFVSATDSNSTKSNKNNVSFHDCLIIGAGWSGLGVGACLSENNVNDFMVLEKGNRVGYFWSQLYDTIRMNTYKHRLWHSPQSIEPSENKDYRTKVLCKSMNNTFNHVFNLNMFCHM